MVDVANIESVFVNGLQTYLSSEERPCTVLMANQTAPVPPYPYLSYTIITPIQPSGGTFSIAKDGTYYRTLKLTISLTVQSESDTESMTLALKAHDWFSLVGCIYLSDNGIVVERVGNASNRDNLLTVEYEYRNGFDVTLVVTETISAEEANGGAGYIETLEIEKLTITKEE